jgi:hypothetical protein|tara:strand:+ start:9111 stop:10136 length:1026 start_codon:yes stop_codon:yes gene_type:complete
MNNEGLSGLYEQVIYETRMKILVDKEFYSIIKEYYTLSGDYINDSKNVNELYNLLNEEGFDPFAHGSQDVESEEDENICVLNISASNSKLEWPYLSLPAGYTCPMATVCKSFAAKPGNKFKDGTSIKAGPEREFMCYAARQQAQYSKTAGKNAFSNLTLLSEAGKVGGIDGMAELIINSIQYHGFHTSKVFRIHEGGDFFSSDYLKAWIQVAKHFSNIKFYTHTTSLNFWLSNKSSIPRNMNLIASVDKNNEDMIMKNKLRYARVVYSVEEAAKLGLSIDFDDSIAAFKDESFALLLHGQQPAGSDASKAVGKTTKDGTFKKMKGLHKANKTNRTKMLNQR